MSREAAERLAKAEGQRARGEHWRATWEDVFEVNAAYLALLTPTEDDERIAREIQRKWYGRFIGVEAVREFEHDIAQALAAKGARQREVDAKIIDDYENGMAGRLCCAGQRHHLAAAIRSQP